MLQIISTFSSFAAPTSTTLSVTQTGASDVDLEMKWKLMFALVYDM